MLYEFAESSGVSMKFGKSCENQLLEVLSCGFQPLHFYVPEVLHQVFSK